MCHQQRQERRAELKKSKTKKDEGLQGSPGVWCAISKGREEKQCLATLRLDTDIWSLEVGCASGCDIVEVHQQRSLALESVLLDKAGRESILQQHKVHLIILILACNSDMTGADAVSVQHKHSAGMPAQSALVQVRASRQLTALHSLMYQQ